MGISYSTDEEEIGMNNYEDEFTDDKYVCHESDAEIELVQNVSYHLQQVRERNEWLLRAADRQIYHAQEDLGIFWILKDLELFCEGSDFSESDEDGCVHEKMNEAVK